ncbi:unnamed protein product [Linum tenue]|uniref:TIR domain-containing protein n=1 Tax=Linum tenue TaxID=586396 RepID=A0AAV0LUN5_9ROSI|nr:unnamed protein product [Linum tenue]
MELTGSNAIASSSCSPYSLPVVEYEVFLSFRGPDVRTTFADFLYRLLDRPKIRTFLDDEELRKGEMISPSLVKAIGESRIYIPILSPGYASSKWCLQELALMLERYKQDEGSHIILPIFYLMEPRDVRHCKGSYEEALEQHRLKYGEETIRVWKDALEEVGQMTGWRVTESDRQGAVAESVFSEVWSHIKGNYTLLTNELIGIDSHVNHVMELLKSDFEGGINVVGIHGMGGIGKTTIAKAVYNKVFTQFEHHCFLEDVRETLSLKNDGVTTLQSKIISSILRDDHMVRDASQGIHIITNRVCPRKVLIVLDNVDDRFEFGQILGEVRKFSPESRFIITTRDKRVLELLQVSKLYEPSGMSHDHSLQLLRRHAFRMDNPLEDKTTLCEEFVKVAAGLPLALEVIGSLLFRRDRKFWEAKLIELKRIPPTKVQERLKISYDELSGSEKQIFLDISCVFIGENKELPFYMWSDCNFNPESGISTLILRSLLKVDVDNKFWMHDHVRDIGRMIVREEDEQHPWKRTRIWSNEDAVDMLINGEGADLVEVLKVDMRYEDFELMEKEFQNLSKLRYLEVHSGRLTGDFKNILPNLRWLRLHYCRSIPININITKLAVLDLRFCPVRDDWRCWDKIKGCPSLQRINFLGCGNMSGELHIGDLKGLRVLNIARTKITKLIGGFGRLQNLQEINVGYSRLREIPTSIGKLSSLKILVLDRLDIEVPKLPTSLKGLSLSSPRVPNLLELKDLEWLHWSRALLIPGDMWKLSKLKDLELWQVECRKNAFVLHQESALPSSLNTLSISGYQFVPLERLPNLVNQSNLTYLDLSEIGVHEIAGLGELRMLENFDLRDASNLIDLDGLQHLKLLKELRVYRCDVLRKLPSLSNLTKLQTLKIFRCPLLSEIHGLSELAELSTLRIIECRKLTGVMGIDKLESLQVMKIRDCSSIEELPDVSALEHLRELKITGCNQLTEVMGVDKLESLQELTITNCVSIKKLPDLSTLKLLRELTIRGCNQLPEVVGIERLKSLQLLEITDCTSIEKLPDLSALEHLRELKITGCNQLTEVIGLGKLESLRELMITDCALIKKLPDLSALEHLWALTIIRCNQLPEVAGIERLKSLELLELTECTSIERLPDLSALEHLRNLKITGCNQLTEVIGLDKLESLQALRITDCASIKKLPDLFALEHLRELIITGCNQLTEVTGIERLKWSRYFTIDERLKTQKRLEHERWELLHRANNSRPKKWSRFHSCWGVCRKDSDIISL